MKNSRPVLKDETLYLGDNGRCLCGEHSGMTARFTGRDISGQKVEAITPELAREWRRQTGSLPTCENPRCGRKPSLIHPGALTGIYERTVAQGDLHY